jgi:hypothetical protein
MAHNSRCSGAKTNRCSCSCNGELHGGATSLVHVAVSSPVAQRTRSSDLLPAGNRATNKRARAMVRAKADVESWLAAATASPPDSVSAVTAQTVGMVSDAVANAVVDALNQNGYHRTAGDHVVCDFLAAAARAMQELQDQFDRAVAHMVSAILASRRRDHRPIIPGPLATVAAQAAVNALAKLSVTQHFDDLLRATRLLGVMMCPAPEHHRAVVLYCLSPLEKGILSDATRQALTDSLPRGWMTPRLASIS